MKRRAQATKKTDLEEKKSEIAKKEVEEGPEIPDTYWYVGLAAICLFSFYLRAVLPWHNVFIGDAVRFSSESDAWYHMMLAKSTVLHLQRTFFDPLTYFPYGTSIHFGPFVSWGIAILSYIAGLGRPSMHTVEVVGAFWPALLGTLLVLPTYYVGKEIAGKGCGLLAALLVVILPGQLFSRTTLGFTDHHSSETLLSTLIILFFLMALRTGRDLSFRNLLQPNQRTSLLYALLAGISMGLYLDAWAMGILFEGILLIFLFLQGTVDHLRGRGAEYLGILGAVVFGLALLLLLPFANPANGFSIIQYSLFQPTMLVLGVAFCLLMFAVSVGLQQRGMSGYAFPGGVLGSALLGILALYALLPQFVKILISGLGLYLLPRTGGAATVAELSTLLSHEGIQSNFPGLFGLSPFYFAIIALALQLRRYWQEEKPADLLVIVWSLVILAITLAMNRSAYYYSVNIALLCAYLGVWVLQLTNFGELERAIMRRSDNPVKFLTDDLKFTHLLAILAIVVLLIFPSMSVSVQMGKYATGPTQDWFTSISWLKDNTPEPGLDIYGIYPRPPAGQHFQYPDTAYGVMSWWDYGHLIETIGHRYPNANPFQEGIGNISAGIPGSSPFFLAESEKEAEQVLAGLDKNRSAYSNTRFVMTDIEMAVGKFYAMTAWSAMPITRYYGFFYQQQGNKLAPIRAYRDPYFKTMVARLHFFDGTETPVGEAFAIAYRPIVQEGTVFSVITEPPKVSNNYEELRQYVNDSVEHGYRAEIVSTADPRSLTSSVPLEALKHYRLVHESESTVTYGGQKYVKTFEHVPGAVIKGQAPKGAKVSIAVPIMTNRQRAFIYRQSNVSDGEYTQVVPYSTEGPMVGGTNFDTAPLGPYQLTVGDRTYEVRVPEEMVMTGGTITV